MDLTFFWVGGGKQKNHRTNRQKRLCFQDTGTSEAVHFLLVLMEYRLVSRVENQLLACSLYMCRTFRNLRLFKAKKKKAVLSAQNGVQALSADGALWFKAATTDAELAGCWTEVGNQNGDSQKKRNVVLIILVLRQVPRYRISMSPYSSSVCGRRCEPAASSAATAEGKTARVSCR